MKVLFLFFISSMALAQGMDPPLPSATGQPNSVIMGMGSGFGGMGSITPYGSYGPGMEDFPSGQGPLNASPFIGYVNPNHKNPRNFPTLAYIGNEFACPFRRNPADNASSLISGVVNALSDLKDKCPSLANSIQNVQAQAEFLNQNLTGTNPMRSGMLEVNCQNYQTALRKEFDHISENPSMRAQRSQRYSSCSILETNKQQACIDKTYVENLSETHFNCAGQYNEAKNETLKKSVQSLATQMNTLLNQSSTCDKPEQIKKSLLSAGINTLSTIAAVAPGAGLASLILGTTGPLLNTLVNTLFSKASPQEGIEALNNEVEAENLSCLWYNLQNRTLNCSQNRIEKQTPRSVDLNICGQPAKSQALTLSPKLIENLKNLDSIIKSSASDPRAAPNTLEILEKVIPSVDESSSLSLTHKIEKMKVVLAASNEKSDKEYAKILDEFLRAKNEFTIKSKKTADPEKLHKMQKELMGKIPSNWEQITSAYWKLNSKNDPLASLKASEELKLLVSKGYQIALENIQFQESADDYQQSLHIASNYMVTNFKNYFEKRLQELNQRYETNKDESTNKEKLGDLKPLFALCSQAAAIYQTSPVSNPRVERSFNNISSPSNSYINACSRFNCTQPPSLIRPFQESDFDAGSKSQKFRAYQCKMVGSYDDNLLQLERNVLASSEPCGQAR